MTKHASFFWRIVTLVIIYQLTRLVFFYVNSQLYVGFPMESLLSAFMSGLRFDFSAIAFINIVYAILFFFPKPQKWEKAIGPLITFGFLLTNACFISFNMFDTEYFQFAGKRLTLSSFSNSTDAVQLGQIFYYYWQFTAITIGLILMLWKYKRLGYKNDKNIVFYYTKA